MSDYETTVRTLGWLEADQLDELCEDLPDEAIMRIHDAVTKRLMNLLDEWTAQARKMREMSERVMATASEPSYEQDYQDVDDARRARELK